MSAACFSKSTMFKRQVLERERERNFDIYNSVFINTYFSLFFFFFLKTSVDPGRFPAESPLQTLSDTTCSVCVYHNNFRTFGSMDTKVSCFILLLDVSECMLWSFDA